MYVSTVMIPAGACPFPLNGTDKETVRQWAEKVRRHFADNHQDLMIDGLAYFVRQYFYDFDTPEYKEVKQFLFGEYAETSTALVTRGPKERFVFREPKPPPKPEIPWETNDFADAYD